MSKSKRSSVSPVEDNRMHEALEKVRKELEALTEAELIHINIDIPAALATAFGALPALRAMRARIEVEAQSIDLKQLDKLETYMLALFHAQTLYATATRPTEPLPELVETATALREVLYADALALVQRGLLDAEQLRGVKNGPGHRPLAFDLTSLAQVMRGAWETIGNRTSVQPEELREASELAERLLSAIGEREFSAGAASEAGAVRQRVFTLFMRAYDEFRRAMTFLRWREGDADKIAPSLYAGRASGGRRKTRDDEPESDTSTAPTGAASGSDEASSPASPVRSDGEITAPSSAGMPDSDPFVAA